MDVWRLMAITREQLGQGTSVKLRIGSDSDDLARSMAEEMAQTIVDGNLEGRPTCMIVPVGPVGQFEHLARLITARRIDCSRVTFLNMDEFLGDDGGWIDPRHPLSFRGFMDRSFYQLLPAAARFVPANRVFPDPRDPLATRQLIAERGGVDVCFGGIGLNGHLAFNEPELPEVRCTRCGSLMAVRRGKRDVFLSCSSYPRCRNTIDLPDELRDSEGQLRGPLVSVEEFAARSTRVLTLAAESRAHMAVNLSCALDLVPRRAVTVGMHEILTARRLSFFANRPWQRGVVRQALHGPVTPLCPASYLQRHSDAMLTVADYVAETPDVRLR